MLHDSQWWFPVVTDRNWCRETRDEHPDDGALDDEEIRDKYAHGGKYQCLWDHVGDAREEYEKLADAYFELREMLERDR